MAFRPTNFQLGGSFVQDISSFQRSTSEIGGFFAGKARTKNIAAAELEGAATTELEQRGTFRAADRAFNEASLKGYEASIQNDVMENVARIEAENPSPDAFSKAMDGYKLGLLSEVNELVKPQIAGLLDTLETKSRIRIQGAFITRTNDENKALADQAQEGFRNEAFSALFNGDQVTFEQSRASFLLSLDNPLYSVAEVADRINAFDDQADETQILGGIDRLYDDDPRKALVALSDLQNANPEDFDMTPQRQQELVSKGFASVLNRTKLSEQIETLGDEEVKRLQDVAEADLTAKAYSSDLSQAEFLQAVNSRLITPSAADRIRKRMNNVVTIKDDPNFILTFERDLPDLPTAEAEALLDNAVANGQLTASSVGRLQRAIASRDQKEEDEAIKINRGLLEGFAKEQGFFSKFDPQAEKRFVSKMADYNQRVADGEDPRATALDIIENGSQDNEIVLKTLPSLRFGSIDDLNQAETDTLQALDRGEIDESRAENELDLIQTMQRLKGGIK